MLEKKDLRSLQQSVSALFEAGRYKQCIDLTQQLIHLGQEANDCEALHVGYYTMALASYYNGDIHQAFTYIVRYDEFSLMDDEPKHRVRALMLNYLLHVFLENYDIALRDLWQAVEIGERLKDEELLSQCYKRLAFIHNELSQYSEAEHYALKSLQYANQLKDERYDGICRAYIQLINSYIGQQRFAYAMCYIEDLITIGLENFSDRQKASALNVIGKYYFANGHYKDSLNMYFHAKAYAQSSFDLKLLSIILKNMIEQCELERNYMLGYEMQREYIETISALNRKELMAIAMQLETKKNLAKIERTATLDPLTGVYNRGYLEKQTNKWLAEDVDVRCIAFDIDRFKLINDEYGHLVGDEVLKALVEVCERAIPTHKAILARYGGDEFVIIVRAMSAEQTITLAQTLMRQIRSLQIDTEELSIHITVSMGIALNEMQQQKTFYALFKEADASLYKAKALGRNQMYYVEMQSQQNGLP